MGKLVNTINYSKSRADRLRECMRRYWSYHYGSWEGWDRKAPKRARDLYVLKRLSSRYSWPGVVVHDAIKGALEAMRAGRTVYPAEIIAKAKEQMRRDFEFSRRREYWRVPKSFGLVEHEYQMPVTREEWAKVAAKVETGIAQFFKTETLALALKASPQRWLPVDEEGSFEFEGVTVYAAPDFAWNDDGPHGEELTITDWKTGKPKEADLEQLATYAEFARLRWGATRVVGRLVYLGGDAPEEYRYELGPEDVNALFAQTARARIAVMREFHGKPESAFPKTDNMSECRRCWARSDCWPDGVPVEDW